VAHQIRNTQSPGMELAWVSFTLAPGADDARLRRFSESSVRVVAGGSVATVWSALRTGAEQGVSPAELQALVTALLLGILRTGAGADTDPRSAAGDAAAQRAVRFIHDQLHRPLTVPEIAAAAGVSPRQLTRLLARFTGVAPAAYVERARIERASTLLLRTDDPIKMVASRAGYGDVHRFTRAFARVVGCPPGLFRRSGGAAGRRAALTEETAGSLV
jgi:transcriptional regulator GlxA family with amidase domain